MFCFLREIESQFDKTFIIIDNYTLVSTDKAAEVTNTYTLTKDASLFSTSRLTAIDGRIIGFYSTDNFPLLNGESSMRVVFISPSPNG